MDTTRLDGDWSISWCETGSGTLRNGRVHARGLKGPVRAKVPGEVHWDLVRAGIIKEPLTGLNAKSCRWVEEYEWWYRREFFWEPQPLHKRVELVFDGLDTTADIYLNGRHIGTHNNCYTPCRVDVTDKLLSGKNVLIVRVDNGVWSTRHRSSRKRRTPARYFFFVRKPAFSFGWDWAPRLVNCGIWKSVRIEAFNVATLRSVILRSAVAGRSATVRADITVEGFSSIPVDAEVEFCITHRGVVHRAVGRMPLRRGLSATTLDVVIRDPLLWWPRSLGHQHLHPAAVQVRVGGRVIGEYRHRYGIRTVEIDRRNVPGEDGHRFTVYVNGVPVFCKGANWAPPDAIIPRASDAKYRHLLSLAREANFTMLRVWAGGIYERPLFYELCDRYGILVWQDFHFSCALYPDDDPVFCETVRREAEYVVTALGNYACIALFCGNNENHHFYTRGQWGKVPFYGKKIYHRILPAIIKRYHPEIPYWPGSPYGGRPANSRAEGDVHSYRVSLGENGLAPLEKRSDYRYYREELGKFISEFGYFGPPAVESMKKYLSTSGMTLTSPECRYHTNWNETGVLRTAISLFITNPEGLPLQKYVLAGQVVQAEGLKYALEHFRSRMFACSGSLFWMFSDCWGEIGWSIVDYYGVPKAAYYAVKRAYAPVAVLLEERSAGVLEVLAVNDTRKPLDATLEVGVQSLSGVGRSILIRRSVKVPACAAKQCAVVEPFARPVTVITVHPAMPETVNRQQSFTPRQAVVYARLTAADGRELAWNRYFSQPLRETDIPVPNMSVHKERAGKDVVDVRITAENFILGAYVTAPAGCRMSDNFCDILPGRTVTLRVYGPVRSLEQVSVSCCNTLFCDVRRCVR